MIGTTLSHFRITAKLGEGGMGEVYRAEDTRLDREVAIKVLPSAFTEDPERLARFEREAKLLASLSHPNIAAIYEIGEAEGLHFLAMELAPGEDLADRLERGAVPIDEAIEIALQIARALEAAHDSGVVHRDLKPANVMVDAANRVKVLDFGLATAVADTASQPDLSVSPTLTAQMTRAGVILGTAAYMSPEQAKGKPVDKRADIWSFGVILWETLTGKRLFTGESVSDTLAAVLRDDVSNRSLPASTPAGVRRLLTRCLERDPEQRLRDIGEARIALSSPGLSSQPAGAEDATEDVGRSRSGWVRALGLAIASLLLGTALGWWSKAPEQATGRATNVVSLNLPEGMGFSVRSYPGASLAISRDGRRVAYVDPERNPNNIFVRELGTLRPRSIESDVSARQPFFSPDGRWIGYFGGTELQKISVDGGRAVTLVTDFPNAEWVRGSWSDDGRIVYDTWNAGLRVVSAEGGPIRELSNPEDEWHLAPTVIPGTDRVLFFVQSEKGFRIEAMSLDGGPRTVIVEDASQPTWLASGHLLFRRRDGLFVAPFDVEALRLTGPVLPLDLDPMVDDLRVGSPVPQLAVSLDGTLVYAPLPAIDEGTELVWTDRSGHAEPVSRVPFTQPTFDLSPDGRQLAIFGRQNGLGRLVRLDLARKTLTPLRDERLDMPTGPVFSADGSEIFYGRYGTHRGDIVALPIGGGEPRVVGQLEGTWLAPFSTSADGRWLVGSLYHPETAGDLWAIDLTADSPDEAARVIAATPEAEIMPSLSPDGRWLAYVSLETGSEQVFVQRFPDGGSRTRASIESALMPHWSPDGRELFMMRPNGTAMYVVSVETEPELSLGSPELLFEGHFWPNWDAGPGYATSQDASRLMMGRKGRDPVLSNELVVIQNWFDEIERRFDESQSSGTGR